MNIGKVDIGSSCRAIFWDLGGREELRPIWAQYYADTQGLVYVIDAADPSRFQESRSTLLRLLENPLLTGIPLLIIANKQDLAEAATSDEIDIMLRVPTNASANIASPLPSASGEKRSRTRPTRIQAVSCYTKSGIEEGIRWLVQRILDNPPPPRRTQKS